MVNAVSMLYPSVFICLTFPVNYVIDTQGIRRSVLLGTFLTAVGISIKAFTNVAFIYCIIGQFIAAIGQPFLINVPAKLAAVWFGPQERVLATTITVAS